MTFSSSLDAWTGSYTIISSDQLGTQTVTVSAADSQGNTGSGTHQITIVTTPGLSVSITSPSPNSVFNRGETVTIAVSVSRGGSPVTGATVTANTPAGGTISLTNVGGGGIYSTQYTILGTDPVGLWTITVQASQGGQSGSSQIVETISSTLNVAVSTSGSSSFTSPQDSFNIGQTVFVKAAITLQDGTVVSSGSVSFTITGTSVTTTPVVMTFRNSVNAWIGSYTLLATDQVGIQVVTVMASNAAGNAGSGTHSIGVQVPAPTTTQPLEAAVTFNPSTQDLQVNAVCNPGCVGPTTVTQTSTTTAHGEGHGENRRGGDATIRTYTISDSAGHTLTLTVRLKHHGHELKAKVMSVQYGNSAPIRLPHNKLSFEYSLSKEGSLKTLEQKLHADDTKLQADFSANKGVTTITVKTHDSGDDDDGGGNKITKSGLWLLEIVTANGGLNGNFFQST